MSRKKTQEEYVAEVAIKNPTVEVVGEYVGANIPILHRCIIHDVAWNAYPSSILKGHGCRCCCGDKLRAQKIKDHQQYVEEVLEINPNIKVIEQYRGNNIKILHQCLIDGYEWKARPGNILYGKGCPKCSGHITRTDEEYKSELHLINPNIQPIEEYIDTRTKIKHICLIDGYIWNVAPYSTLAGYGCPKCAGNIKRTHDEYVVEVEEVNPDIEVIGTYINANTPITHMCKVHNREWNATPNGILAGYGCPECRESSGERQIRQWLEKHNISYTFQKIFNDCKDQKPLPFDFYLQQYNICIEFDGRQHFMPVDFANKGEEWAMELLLLVQRHDEIKNQYCKDNNIHLLRIPYFKNVEKELEEFLFI